MAFSPNLFGSNSAMEAWDKIKPLIGYRGDDDYQIGDRPLMKLVSKSLLKKNRRKLIAKVSESTDTYMPGILIIGFLFMEKGLPLTSDIKRDLRDALAEARLKVESVPKQWRTQRKRQLSHIENLIEGEYEPSTTGTRVMLYGTKTNKRRNHKRNKKERELKKRSLKDRREMTPQEARSLAYTYLLMRVFNSATKTNALFKTYAPNVNVKQLCDYMYNQGFCDDRCRPNQYFRDRIYTLLREKQRFAGTQDWGT